MPGAADLLRLGLGKVFQQLMEHQLSKSPAGAHWEKFMHDWLTVTMPTVLTALIISLKQTSNSTRWDTHSAAAFQCPSRVHAL